MKVLLNKRRIILSAILFLLLLIVSYFVFFNKVNFYKPVNITIKGISAEEFLNIECVGYSPYGKEQIFSRHNQGLKFFSEHYMHCKDIKIYIPAELFEKISSINFDSGKYNKDIDSIKLKQIFASSNCFSCGTIEIKLSECFSPPINFFDLYFSTLYWGGVFRIIYITFLIILLLTFRNVIRKSISFVFKLLGFVKLSGESENMHDIDLVAKFVGISKNRFLIAIVLFMGLFAYYSFISNFTGATFKMNDIYYHSAGVNFAKGHGISRIGAMENMETYEFEDYDINLEFNYRFFTRLAGLKYYHHPPGYGLFLGLTYKLFGVNVIYVKYIQLFLMILIASSLPLFAYEIWGYRAYFLSILSATIFSEMYYNLANDIEPQALMFFLNYSIIVLYYLYYKKRKYLHAILLGLMMSIAILTKVTLYAFPILMALHLIFVSIKSKKYYFRSNLVILISFLFPIILWSFYANFSKSIGNDKVTNFDQLNYELFESPLSKEDSLFLMPKIIQNPKIGDSNVIFNDGGHESTLADYNKLGIDIMGRSLFDDSFIFIARQTGSNTILGAHNEYIDDGGFNFHWFRDKSSFYNNDGLEYWPSWFRVINFYLKNPLKTIELSLQKLYRGFGHYKFLLMFIIAFILNTLISKISQKFSINSILTSVILNFGLISILFINFSFILFVIILLLFIFALIYEYFKKTSSDFFKIPASINLMIISLVLVTIVTAGNKRFTETLGFIYILLGIHSLYYLNMKILVQKQNN